MEPYSMGDLFIEYGFFFLLEIMPMKIGRNVLCRMV